MISPENIVKAKKKKRIVIKVGTSSLTQPNGKVNIYFIDHLARQISDLSNRDMDVILVSSGAIGIGMPVLGFEHKPNYLPYRQACAAVGQNILMGLYGKCFHDYGKTVAQLLMTKGDALNTKRYMHMKGALSALLELGVIPIINENDAVTVDEIKIGDNDTLSAIVASVAEADLLILLSDIEGLYDKDPHEFADAHLIHDVPHFTRELFNVAGGAGSARGTGGMYTKLLAAEICVHSGIDMVIAKSDAKEILQRIISGESIGTFFHAENVHPQMKRREIIIGSNVRGKIFIDKGCSEAILNKGSSLLAIGITKIEGIFSEGDAVSLFYGNHEIARGISHYGSVELAQIKGLHTKEMRNALGTPPPYDTVIHRDNLLVMR